MKIIREKNNNFFVVVVVFPSISGKIKNGTKKHKLKTK